MSHINVTINGRQYRMACEEGQEARLLRLAESLESRIGSLRGKFGEIGDARLTVMAALTVCDELVDANNRIRSLEEELEALRDVRVVAADRARATQVAVANALNSAADRIEKTTQVLNRTIGGGVAIGEQNCPPQTYPSLRGANGSRECAPDDRLHDEAIHPALLPHGLLRFARNDAGRRS